MKPNMVKMAVIRKDDYAQPRTWWDVLMAVGVGVLTYVLLTLWSLPCLHPSVWDDVAVAAGLRPPAHPFPGLYQILVGGLFSILPTGVALDALSYLGRMSAAVSSMFVYLVFRDMLPATLRIKVHMARIVARVGRLIACLAALLFVCSDPVWRAGQTFTPVSLFLLLTTGAGYLFFRFLHKGELPCLYACGAVLGVISADSVLGFLLSVLVACVVAASVRWARNPKVPLVNPLVDDLVREVVFKRLSYIWTLFFTLTVGMNVWRFIALGGMQANGLGSVLGVFLDYFRGAFSATCGAASGMGWLFILLLAVAPFVLAIKLLPRAWDDDRFLPWAVGMVYALLGAAALSQLAGMREFWFWRRVTVTSDMLLASALVLDAAVVVFVLAVFGVDALCRNYRRIAQQKFPDSVLETVPARMADSLKRARVLRKAIFWTVLCTVPLLVVPGRICSDEREMARLIAASVEETLRETEGCETIFTDGSFDALLELEALRRGRPIVCLSLMAPNTPRARAIRLRAVHDEEDRLLLETDVASALRAWVTVKPERLSKSAVQIGFEIWKRAHRPLPSLSGLVALPGGVTDAARARALKACTELGDSARKLAEKGRVVSVADHDLRAKFPFVLWRLSRLAQIRGRVADEVGNSEEACREAEWADELDAVNAQVQKMKRDMDWLRMQNGGQPSPREGLVICLMHADFRLAGRYAAPILVADPDEPRANFALGMKYYQEGQYSRAERCLVRCLKRRPDEPAVLNNLAIVQVKLGRLDDAERNVRHALETHPGLTEAKKTLEQVLKARTASAPH